MKEILEDTFCRYVASIRKPENLIIQDTLGENYHARSHNSIELNANLYDPSRQFD